MKRYENFPLKQHHTFGMDVCAVLFVEYDTVEELRTLLTKAQNELSSLKKHNLEA